MLCSPQELCSGGIFLCFACLVIWMDRFPAGCQRFLLVKQIYTRTRPKELIYWEERKEKADIYFAFCNDMNY